MRWSKKDQREHLEAMMVENSKNIDEWTKAMEPWRMLIEDAEARQVGLTRLLAENEKREDD